MAATDYPTTATPGKTWPAKQAHSRSGGSPDSGQSDPLEGESSERELCVARLSQIGGSPPARRRLFSKWASAPTPIWWHICSSAAPR